MSSKLLKSQKKNRAALVFAGAGLALVSANAMSIANADTISTDAGSGQAIKLGANVTAGSFDLTKQATGDMNFPVQFDRPSGVNAAALAGTVIELGSGSTLYQSAVKAVPELSDTAKMNSLLSGAMDTTSANYASSRATIVKLINWYNSLGGHNITTQDGKAYTAGNLDSPINVLAVAFSNNNSINSKATDSLAELNNAKTVGAVEKALEAYKSGVSQPYNAAFDAYAQKVYAKGADINALSTYNALKPTLDAYQNMYANGAAAIRTTLLDGATTSTEAGVTFFESAVIAGPSSNNGGDNNDNNTPKPDTSYTTKWVDKDGKTLSPADTNKTGYGAQKSFDGYTYKTVTTDDATHTKTYVYEKVVTPEKTKTQDTVWVDEAGKELKPKESGTKPDTDGKSDIPGYVVISVDTKDDKDGNTHTINMYHKVASDTVWVDKDGKALKPKAEGSFPDNDGKSDIPGYTLVKTETNTAKNGDVHVINTYEKTPAEKKVHTNWVDESGKPLKPQAEGSFPDNDGKSDIPGYTLVSTTTDGDGNVTNTYEKNKTPDAKKVDTYWFDTDGNTLKPKVEGTFPDNDGKSDIQGYELTQTITVTAEMVAKGGTFDGAGFNVGDTINIYKKVAPKPDAKVVTQWVDDAGKTLKPKAEGSFPDNDGKSDIPGYTLVRTDIDAEGNVTNVYTAEVKEVKTSWVDKDGKPLSPDVTGKDFGAPKKFDGYHLVGEPTISADGTHKTYHYDKDVVTVKTSWVDKDGKSLAPDVTDKAFGASKTFVGYHLVGEPTMSEDGKHKTYHYDKDVVILKTSWVDKDGKPLAPDATGEEFGKSKTFEGYHLVGEPTMSEDGKHMTYHYDKDAKDGKDGKDGNPGKDGANGTNGIDGKDGNDGNDGTDGTDVTPAPAKSSAKTLPQTGTDESAATAASVAGAGLLSMLGLAGLAKRRRKGHAE